MEHLSKRILVIDDDADILDAMQCALSYQGFEVITSTSTADILKTVQQQKPHLLLIDYLLNGINGGELCSQIKKDAATCRLPVILMSAYPRVFKSLGDYSCNLFVAKPFDLGQLVKSIRQLII